MDSGRHKIHSLKIYQKCRNGKEEAEQKTNIKAKYVLSGIFLSSQFEIQELWLLEAKSGGRVKQTAIRVQANE